MSPRKVLNSPATTRSLAWRGAYASFRHPRSIDMTMSVRCRCHVTPSTHDSCSYHRAQWMSRCSMTQHGGKRVAGDMQYAAIAVVSGSARPASASRPCRRNSSACVSTGVRRQFMACGDCLDIFVVEHISYAALMFANAGDPAQVLCFMSLAFIPALAVASSAASRFSCPMLDLQTCICFSASWHSCSACCGQGVVGRAHPRRGCAWGLLLCQLDMEGTRCAVAQCLCDAVK